MKVNKTFSEDERNKKISYYEKLASDIKLNLVGRKRPLIIEFTGLPKSGKTTVSNSLSLFLRRNDIPPYIVDERASVCPIPNKNIPEFNIWTGCTTLANLLKCKYEKKYSVIILDRGIFDSLIWMNLLFKEGKLTNDDFCRIEKFLLLERWIKYVDLVIYMYCEVQTALKREYKDLLTKKEGSIMNENILKNFLKTAEECIIKYKSHFNKIIVIDTTNTLPIEGVDKVTSEAIESLKELSDEKIIVIPQEKYKKHLNIIGFEKGKNRFKILERLLNKYATAQRRSIVEEDKQKLQIVVCSIIRYEDKIALFTKHEIHSDKRFHGKNMIWLGGHLHESDIDNKENITLQKSVTNCLIREIEEEIQIAPKRKPVFKGVVYDKTHTKSLRHLGIVFQIELKDPNIFNSINLKTLTEPPGQSITIEFIPLKEKSFIKNIDMLEPWSIDILQQLFNIDLSKQTKPRQTILF